MEIGSLLVAADGNSYTEYLCDDEVPGGIVARFHAQFEDFGQPIALPAELNEAPPARSLASLLGEALLLLLGDADPSPGDSTPSH